MNELHANPVVRDHKPSNASAADAVKKALAIYPAGDPQLERFEDLERRFTFDAISGLNGYLAPGGPAGRRVPIAPGDSLAPVPRPVRVAAKWSFIPIVLAVRANPMPNGKRMKN